MSEHQYYEWQAVDRPLTEKELVEVNRLSSHMDLVTPHQAIVTYSWGDFKHDEMDVLLQYFDAFFYIANRGDRRLIFRFPRAVIDPDAIRPYCVDELIELSEYGSYAVLDICISSEEGFGWIEPEGTLSQLVPLRDQIIQGDYRMLYLAWLAASAYLDLDEEQPEQTPPVPAGLKNLTPGLEAFVETFEIDPYLVEAASEDSPDRQELTSEELQSALDRLSYTESRAFLIRLLNGEPQVAVALKKRLASLAGTKPASVHPGRSNRDELFERATALEAEENRRQQQAAEKKRVQELNELARREDQTWQRVGALIEEKKARSYDEAVGLLVKLRDLADYQDKRAIFADRLHGLMERNKTRPAVINRLRQAGLV